MKTDVKLQQDVQNELSWTPSLSSAEIGVGAKSGVVTLSGIVDSYSKKLRAEEAAKRVSGVQAVASELKVEVAGDQKKSDADIAAAAINALMWNIDVPDNLIKLKVEDGWITLTGTVNWDYQRTAAENSVQHLVGVKWVTDDINVKPSNRDFVEKEAVIRALDRDIYTAGAGIRVDVVDNEVILTGKVGCWFDKEEAGRVAWSAPGVANVENDIIVEYAD